jgi:hypothetical protein
VLVAATSDNYNLVVTHQGNLYLQPLKDYVCLPSEMLFPIRGKLKHGDQADALKMHSGNWVQMTLDPTSLVQMSENLDLEHLGLPSGPITMDCFLGCLENAGIVRTNIPAHDHTRRRGVRMITPRRVIVLDVPVCALKAGKVETAKTIHTHLDMDAVRNSEHLAIVHSMSYIRSKNECQLGYPMVCFNKSVRLRAGSGLTLLAALDGNC